MSGFGEDGARRPSMVDVLRGGLEGARGGAGGASLRALRDLAWRQKYNGAEVYELGLKSGDVPARFTSAGLPILKSNFTNVFFSQRG